MSGGHFDYNEYRIKDIIYDIEQLIINNGREKTEEEMKDEIPWNTEDWFERYPDTKYYTKYSDEVIEKFKMGVEKIKEAYIYIHRIDYLLSGDDNSVEFLKRLEEDLKQD
jgi:hypothetical protein